VVENIATQIALPSSVYDAIQRTVETYGGVGRGSYLDGADPCCLIAHAWRAAEDLEEINNFASPLRDAVEGPDRSIFRTRSAEKWSDDIVARVNAAKGAPESARISWEEFCREGNVVRDESLPLLPHSVNG
jgi:hypothetical protein